MYTQIKSIKKPIEQYKKDYQLFSNFRGSRYTVLRYLNEFITIYQQYLADVLTQVGYITKFEFENRKIEGNTFIFLNTTFPKVIGETEKIAKYNFKKSMKIQR